MTSSDWEKIKLKEISIVITKGTTPTTLSGGFQNFGINYIKSESLSYEGRIDESKFVRISSETHEQLKRSQIKESDILYSIAGINLGKCGLAKKDYLPANTNQAVAIIRIDQKKADPTFIHYYLRNPVFVNQVNSGSAQSAQPNVNLTDIGNFDLFVPSLCSQRAIAKILGVLDDKIELNRRINKTLEGMAYALFKSWFVDFDPVRAKMEGQQPFNMDAATAALFPSSMDELLESWTEVTLEKIAALNPETWGKNNQPDNIQYVDLANTKWGTIESTTPYAWKDAPSRAQRILTPGDTIVGTVRPGNGSFSFVNVDGLTGSTGFAVLRPKKQIYRELLYYIATSKENIDRLSHLADGGAYPAVRPDVVLNAPFIFSSEEIISAFSKQTAPMLDRVEKNKQENKVLAQLRDYLLPRLISGDIRVSDAEKFVEAA